MKKLIAALGVLFFVGALTAADLTGKWVGKIWSNDKAAEQAVLELKQNGNELTGTIGPADGDKFTIKNGSVAGDKITFDVDSGGPKMHFELTSSEKRLSGDVRAEHEGETRTGKLDVTKTE